MRFTYEQLTLLLYCVSSEYNHVDIDEDSAYLIWDVLDFGDRDDTDKWTSEEIKQKDAQALSMLKELMDIIEKQKKKEASQ